MAAARPTEHAFLIEAARNRLDLSRQLCRSTAEIIRETRLTIDRTLEKLESRSELDAGLRSEIEGLAKNGAFILGQPLR